MKRAFKINKLISLRAWRIHVAVPMYAGAATAVRCLLTADCIKHLLLHDFLSLRVLVAMTPGSNFK